MPANLESLEDLALSLPEDQRRSLASRLLASLPEENGRDTAEIDAAWHSEVLERMKAYDEGRMTAIPAAEVFARLRRITAGDA